VTEFRDRFQFLADQLTNLIDPTNPKRDVLAHLRSAGLVALMKAGWLFTAFQDIREEEAALTVSSLFARARGRCPNVPQDSLGRAFARLPGAGENRSIERRLADLLDTDRSELDVKLRHVVSLLAQQGVGVGWAQLCRDVLAWESPDRRIQKKWARDFWSQLAPKREAETQTEVTLDS
jgi:CRISPR type I-E-associated protein CasB/Cse2